LQKDLAKKVKEAEDAKKYFKDLMDKKDSTITGLDEKLKQIAGKLGTNSTDPELAKKVGDLIAKLNQLETAPKPTPPVSTPTPSSTANSAALQQQKQTKENELQAELQKLRTK